MKERKFKRVCIKCGKKFVNNGKNCKLCDVCWRKSNSEHSYTRGKKV